MNHALSYLLTEKIREYGWIDIDVSSEAEVKKILHQYLKVLFIFDYIFILFYLFYFNANLDVISLVIIRIKLFLQSQKI